MLRTAIFPVLVLMAVTVLQGGCALFPASYQETRYFDLGDPPSLNVGIDVDSVSMLGPYKRRMAYRKSDYELLFDDYNSWTLSPDRMIEDYLGRALGGDKTSGAKIRVDILRFELDLAKNEAVLTVEYTLKDRLERSTFATRLSEPPPLGFAKAMGANAADLAKEIAERTSASTKK